MWRHICAAAILCDFAITSMSYYRVYAPDELPGRRPTTAQAARERRGTNNLSDDLVLARLIVAEGAAVFFMIDSCRRRYRGSQLEAIALAAFGLMSLGLGSLIYYAIWGRLRLESSDRIYGTAFCPECLELLTGKSAPVEQIFKSLMGSRYMGSSERCDLCGSTVRTLWFWFLLPLFPMGSYRTISLNKTSLIGQRCELYLPHVVVVYGIMLLAAGVIAIVSR